QAVVDHRVEHLRVAHAVAEAALWEQVRSLRHRLHPAGHDRPLDVAGTDVLVGHPDRAKAGSTDLVDGLGADLLGDSALDLSLARGDLPLPRLQHLAEYDVLDLVGRDARALESAGDGGATELRRVERREGAAHLPEGGAAGTEDDCLGHAPENRRRAAASRGPSSVTSARALAARSVRT